MKSFQTAALIGVALLLGSCDSLPFLSGGEEKPPEEAPAAAPPAAEVPAAETPPEFSTPLVEEKSTAPLGSLRKPTDPAERLKIAQSRLGRPDPFAVNPITVQVKLPPPKPVGSSTTPTLPNLPGLPTLPLPPGSGTLPGTLPPDQVLVPTVVLPNPTLAKAITVTGIVQVGSSRQAILRSPLEPSSRYVSPGQRVANGQVLVKRIEVRGSEPVVILEESGIEVVKFIGQPAELPPTTPAAPATTDQQNGSA
jgi:hypothetical protein